MSFRLFTTKNMSKMINWYPPYWGAGIKMIHLADDFTSCKVRLKLTFWNKNVFGTQFGGSLYAMSDPFFVLLLTQTMTSKEYIIWDKAATIHFKRPGKGDCFVEFKVPLSKVEEMKNEVKFAGGKKDFLFKTDVVDKENNIIAKVEKLIYVKKKDIVLTKK